MICPKINILRTKKSAGLLVYSHFEVFGVTQVDE